MVVSVLAVPGVAGSVAATGGTGPAATSGSTQASAATDASIDAAATDTTAASDLALQVSIGKGAFEPGKSYQSDATVNISVSAVNTSGTLPEPVSGVDMTITVEGPNGDTTNFTRTSTDGAVSAQYSLEGRPDGRYTVRATSSDSRVTTDGRASFDAGPVVDFYPDFIDAKIEVGRETQITMSATSGGVPKSGVTRTITISEGSSFFGADFSKTVTTGPDGFATVNFTANSTGDYQISMESSNVFTSLTAVEAFADVETNGPAFGRVDGGETVYFTGRLVDDAAPLSNEPITVRIVNRSAFPTQQMTNISTTTDEFGQFVVGWQTPDNEGKSYKAQIYDSNGDRIKYDGGSVFTRREDGGFFDGGGGDGTQGTTTSLETSLDVPMGPRGRLSGASKVVSPGQSVGATVIPRVNGTAQANEEVSYALTYGFGGAVIETGTVTTNGSGVATLQFTVPESAPDDADLSLDTAATLNGNTTNGFGSAAIQDYRVTVTEKNPLTFSGSGFFGATSTFSGQSTGYTYNVTDVPGGDPVEGVRAMVVGEATDRFHATTLDPQAVTTNASGLATASIDIPETVTGTVWREPRYRYWTGVSTGEKVDAYNVTVDGPSSNLDPGGTATFSYTTDSDTAASGILVVATFNESVDQPVVAARRLDPGQSTQVTFPNLAYNVSYTAQVTAINDRALTASSTTNVGVLGNGSDTDTTQPASFDVDQFVAPSSASVGSTATLTATVENTGGEKATKTVDLRFDGQVVDSRTLTLSPGETRVVATSVDADQVGSFTATVETPDDSASSTVDVVVENFACGAATGDPHMATIDGSSYDFQAAGEFTLVRGIGETFTVQGRFVPISESVSVTEAVATEVGNTEVMIDANHSTRLWIGGSPTPLAEGESTALEGGLVRRQGNTYTVVFNGSDGTANATDERVSVTVWGDRVDVEVCLREDRSEPVEGLLGDLDGDTGDDFALDNGTVLPNPPSFDTLYGAYRDSWRVNKSTTLFTYDEGESLSGFYDPNVPREAVSLDDLDDSKVDRAKQLAKEAGLQPGTAPFRNAVLDYVLTNETDYFASARSSADAFPVTGAVQRIGFDYVNQGGSVNLEVNGDREYNASAFSALDGTTVGGVSVNVTTTASNAGHVELSGPIDTFAVGGQETSVDNIEFGPRSNVTANVTFDNVSPSQSSYVVGDSITADGVPAQIIDFTFTDGTDYQQGSATLNNGSTQPPGGSAPSLFPSNVNVWFNVTDVVEQAGDGSGNQNPASRFDWTPGFPETGEQVTFDASNSFDPDGRIVSYQWNFDDGTTATGPTPTHTFDSAGDYEVSLTVTDDQGATQTRSGTVQVSSAAGAVQRIGFDYVNQGGSVNLEVNGDREYNASAFSALDGTTVGGVSVNVTTTASNAGHVELSGPIDTFAVGGQETSVDNIEFGPRSNVTANVTFDNVSPSQSSYVVGDSITADGVPAQIIDFTFTDGTDYQQGSATLNNGSTQPPGGSAPSLFPSNVNVWFNVTDVVEQAGDGTGDDTGSGTAPSRSAPDTITPGGSATVTLQTTVSNSSVTFQEAFSPAFENVSVQSVTVNRDSQNPFLQVTNATGIVVTLQGLSAGDRVTVTYEVSVGPNVQTGTNYTIDGNVTSGTTTELPSNPIAVQQGSPLSGVAGQYDSDFDGEIDIVELGNAAAAYARGDIGITDLGAVAAVYARS